VIFKPTNLCGAYTIELEPRADFRGYFARMFCEKEFDSLGLETHIAQCSVSYNQRKGTLRGMHYQVSPFEEVKVVRCIRGSVYDVIIDLRRNSSTFKMHFAIELDARSSIALYVPAGFAHGFQTLADDSEVLYQMSQCYSADHSRGVRWNDPAFAIPWPEDTRTILERDANYADFE
jgi:dTDP-4-dehydrorhamnose 3,5-epimerase